MIWRFIVVVFWVAVASVFNYFTLTHDYSWWVHLISYMLSFHAGYKLGGWTDDIGDSIHAIKMRMH